METLINGANQFSFDLLQNIHSNQNVVFSSYSLYLSLLMLFSGSQNQTRDEMAGVLKLEAVHHHHHHQQQQDQQQELDRLFSAVQTELELRSGGLGGETDEVLVTSKVLVNADTVLHQSFQDLLVHTFKSRIVELSPASIAATNAEIEALTKSRISELLGPDFATSSLALVNIVCFDQGWQIKFDEKHTEMAQPFRTSATQATNVDMMNLFHKQLMYSYADWIGAHLLQLPYESDKNKKDGFRFNLVWPEDDQDYLRHEDVASLINKISLSGLGRMISGLEKIKMSLRMPRFNIKNQIDFNPILKRMGVRSAFSSVEANFSAISGTSRLFVDKIMQRSFIEVSEKGTEAAVATAIKMTKRSLEVVKQISVDRPFLFFISDSNALILFSGVFYGNGDAIQQYKQSRDKLEL